MAIGGDISEPNDRERLRQHFLERNDPNRWDELWSKGDFLPWDRGTPNPALIDVLSTRKDHLGPPVITGTNGKSRRKRALVPGCGKGYDVFLFAAFGYDAFGLEGSNHVVQACEGFRGEAETREEYKVKDESAGKGDVRFVHGDFFSEDWEKEAGAGGFDVIYDYTFLCALQPSFRPSWSLRMARLLAPKGTLVCLEFPTYKEPSTGGPPFALPPEVYEIALPYPGEEIEYDGDGYVVKAERQRSNSGLVRVAHWQPARTHEIGKGTDWVGLW
jgi:SAM-dependent methyltransferase